MSFTVGPPPDPQDPRFFQWVALFWKWVKQGLSIFWSSSSANYVLHGNPTGDPTWGLVNLTSEASGTLQAAQFPALTGDVTTTAGSLDTTAVMQRDIYRFGFPGTTGAADQDSSTLTTISFDGNVTFTLAPKSPATTWTYYRSGIKYTITGSKTVTIPAGTATTTLYYIYIDATDGTLSVSTSPWTLNDTKVPIATLCRNSGFTPSYLLAEERHSVLIDRRAHYYEHYLEGTRMKTVGALTGPTVSATGDVDKTCGVADSVQIDEDIILSIASLTKPNGTATDYIVFYRTAASAWAWKASNMPFVYNVGNTNNVIQYDSSAVMTDATIGTGTSRRWTNSYLCFSNMDPASTGAGKARMFIIPGRAQFTTLLLAQAEDPSTFVVTNFPCAEFYIAYRLTWLPTTGAGSGQCVLAATPLMVRVNAVQTSGTGATIEHNTLAGLDGGTTGEYYHLTAAQYSNIANSGAVFAFAAAHG